MQVGDRFHNPWVWPSLQNASGMNGCGPSPASQSGQSTSSGRAGDGAADVMSSHFDSFIQSIIAQFQSDASVAGSAASPTPPSPTGTAATTTADATPGTSTTSAAALDAGTIGGVSGHHHWHHHHHADSAENAGGSLASSDLATLENNASELVSTLFGALNAASGTSAGAASTSASTPASLGVDPNAMDATAAASDTTAPAEVSGMAAAADPAAAMPWQKIAGIFAQDLHNAVQAYASQSSVASNTSSPMLNAIA